MPSIPHSLLPLVLAHAGPLAALAAAATGAFLCRGKARRGWLPAVGAAAALLGWALLLPLSTAERAAFAPRMGPEMLLLPAATAMLAVWRGRFARLVPVLLAMFAGWWLAQTPPALAEFWRVGFAVTVLALLLPWVLAGQPARGLAGAAALWGGLVVAGSSAGWAAAALVAAAVWAGLLVAGAGAALPASAVAALVGGADIAGGRLVRAGLNAVDLACAGALTAPLLTGPVQARIGKRFGSAGPVAAAAIGAALSVAGTWVIGRLLRR